MRTLTDNAKAFVATNTGARPFNIIEIGWVDGSTISYADKDVADIQGKILKMSAIDNVLTVQGNIPLSSSNAQISVTLSDTDGTIKAVLDTVDIHKRPVWIYQMFDGLSLADKILLFKGQVNTPIEWDEGARTITIDVVEKIEDAEIGFSIEEGNFVDPPVNMIAAAWPLVFGTVAHEPALRAITPRQGTLGTAVGIHDFTLEKRISALAGAPCQMVFAGYQVTSSGGLPPYHISSLYVKDKSCVDGLCQQHSSLYIQLQEQLSYEYTQITIFGGLKFPQHVTLTIRINQALFTGQFNGELFTIYSRQHPDYDPATGLPFSWESAQHLYSYTQCNIDPNPYDLQVPPQPIDPTDPNSPIPAYQAYLVAVWTRWYNRLPTSSFFWVTAGATVTLANGPDSQIVYIANLLPSTVLNVSAFRNLGTGRQFLTVDPSYYSVREVNYTGYTGVTEILMTQPLSTRDLNNVGGWEDDIYVSLTSSVGPNVVDIMEWFIGEYTTYGIDTTSFNLVRAQIDNYPANFALFSRENIVQVLQEIAFQSRCALYLRNDIFYIKYLSATEEAVDTITVSDIVANSLKLTHTSTEDLVTKYIVTWKEDYAIQDSETMVLRYNLAKYGLHQDQFNYYIYNIADLVRKSATFWLIRRANIWRLAVFKCPLTKLALEVFDTITLNIPALSPNTINCVVQKASYNSDDNMIDMEVWTPCLSGTNVAYNFAFPSSVTESDFFPSVEEQELGYAGGGKGPAFAQVAPALHPLNNILNTLAQQFNVECNGSGWIQPGPCHSDQGTKKISDAGDTKPSANVSSDTSGAVSGGTSPITQTGQDCCAIAQQAADSAATAQASAQQALNAAGAGAGNSGAGGGGGGSSTNNVTEAQKKLPNNNGNPTGACQYTVVVDTLKVGSLIWADGSVNHGDGTGKIENGSIIEGGGGTTTFSTLQAAQEFFNAQIAIATENTSSFGHTVGEEVVWDTTHFGPATPSPDGSPCANGPGSMVAFSPTKPADGPTAISNPFDPGNPNSGGTDAEGGSGPLDVTTGVPGGGGIA